MPRIPSTITENQVKPSYQVTVSVNFAIPQYGYNCAHDGSELSPQILTMYHSNKVSLKNKNQRKIEFYSQLFVIVNGNLSSEDNISTSQGLSHMQKQNLCFHCQFHIRFIKLSSF